MAGLPVCNDCRLSPRDGGVLEEEAQHLPRGVWPPRIGVGASSTASRPSVSGSMDLPLFKDFPAARVGMDSASIGMSSGYATAMHFLLQVRGPLRLRDDMIAVARMHGGVPIPMKDDGRDSRTEPRNRRNVAELGRAVALLHRNERRREVLGGPAGEAGMHADRRIKIGVGCPHDGGGCRSGR